MKLFVVPFLFLISAAVSNSQEPEEKALLKALFWEVKPFIFTNKEGKIDGIIPQMYERARVRCSNGVKVIEFTKRFGTRNEFYHRINNGVPFGQGEYKNMSRNEVFFAPILKDMDPEWQLKNHYRSFSLMKTNELAVIVPRNMIDLPNKILRGIVSCKIIFVIAMPLAVLVSIIIWFIERAWNDDIEHSFIRGTGTTFWWSVVSMTTVGYGDIVPKAPLGRFLALFWLFVGVMVGCVMTATMTDVVSGIGHLSVFGQNVAVLKNSYEEKVASRDYQANVVPANSYEEVLELVRQNKVFAAMMNADVAAWYQDEIKAEDGTHPPLHIIEKVPANLYVNCMMNGGSPSDELKTVIRCMYEQKDEVYTYPQEHYQRYCHTETIHIGSIAELFKSNFFFQALVALVCLLVASGLFYDIFTFLRSPKNGSVHFHPSNVLDRLLGKQNGARNIGSETSEEEHMLAEKTKV